MSEEEEEDEIEEFEDSEDPGVFGNGGKRSIETEVLKNDEFDFLDGISELALLQSELYDVRGKLAFSRSNGEYVPLKLYRSNCRNSLSVSDIQSSMWCERQLEYRYLYPHMKKTSQWKKQEEKKGEEIKKKTEVMLKGSSLHLIKELEVHEPVRVRTVTREDQWAVKLVNTYSQLAIIKEGKLEREISVFGDPFKSGILLNGVIDQVEYSTDAQKLTVTDLKTRRTKSLPGKSQAMGHKIQLMIYKLLLDGFTRGTTDANLLSNHLDLNLSSNLSVSVTDYINDLGLGSLFSSPGVSDSRESRLSFGHVADTVRMLIVGLDLPPVSSMEIHYEFQETNEVLGTESVEYDESLVKEKLESSIKFWKGSREPTGPDIEDLWKCETCQFKDVCTWRKQKTLESSPAAKLNSPLC